ncbi:MAG: hypothetical protein GFH27_549301n26 [Chloroflexi bacterium AL-W]|nr:hypothetical protein [Chloroflexi bacterium AL-N1]NOK68219.1 hypothetical protein [Chloroflexi bacterium AL-N10]NOK73865.1 hypothetical protein [Chloroflexi bacterium AL-N5]NOK82833.1 hypothetical protein [Chloroflexi bacterium AL-W]NOK90355.1 hypothetical protein [Chloroflexi bacterium AL-N15]
MVASPVGQSVTAWMGIPVGLCLRTSPPNTWKATIPFASMPTPASWTTAAQVSTVAAMASKRCTPSSNRAKSASTTTAG